jgi:hypothetical protein
MDVKMDEEYKIPDGRRDELMDVQGRNKWGPMFNFCSKWATLKIPPSVFPF